MSDQKRGPGRPKKEKPPQMTAGEMALFTPEEVKILEAEAHEEAMREHRAEAETRLKDSLKARHKQILKTQTDPNEEMRDILINLAPHADRVTLDGTMYMHNTSYRVTKALYDTLHEVMARTWDHEHEIGNANSKFYKPPREIVLNPSMAGIPNSHLMRV